ncbi:clustered mitochondria-domain-containing protein [Lineolata rhizophorae]|uniref:Clustered mitochondria-domain-containing protein n=1 Tax=Lineolata rhizophorae TaxID=578093 RepID=A0A6A6NVJ2_9PEZI|nr:clustered mitochondria-domain-containing protein [Lineolata rhizophorae]
MASESKNDAPTPTLDAVENTIPKENGDVREDTASEDGAEQHTENVWQLEVKLPHEPYETQIMASPQEQVQDIRQSLVELPHTFQYSCFHLEHSGTPMNDFVDLGEVPGIGPDSVLTLVEDPYTEKEARLHVMRLRELLGASTSRITAGGSATDSVHGIGAGVGLYDQVTPEVPADKPNGQPNGILKSSKPELDVSLDTDASGSVKTVLPRPADPAPKTVKSIAVSAWNPPPAHLRAVGHLLYLALTTLESETFQITAHVSGFYVNRCSANKFDPAPKQSPKNLHAHSLLSLVAKLSPGFDAAFRALQAYNSRKEPLSTFALTNATPPSPWAVPPVSSTSQQGASTGAHQPDIVRSQEAYLLAGADSNETLRDWNEEFQTTRELPKEPVHERVFRERLTSKLFADFCEAAARGAALVARGEVQPLNPNEPRDGQIFVYNNIFFSFGADGVGTFAGEGGDEAARVAVGKDVVGVRAVNQLDVKGLHTPGTVVVDYLGVRVVGQSIVPGIFKQRDAGEQQIDYGAVEGKDVVADNEKFVEPFREVSKRCKVKAHPVWDKEGKRHDLESSVETKGLLGTDGRKYALDLYRLTPLDVAWLEAYWADPPAKEEDKEGEKDEEGEKKAEKRPELEKPREKNYPHRLAVLRQELVNEYHKVKLREFITDPENLALGRKAREEADEKALEEEKPNGEMNGEEASKEVAKKDDDKDDEKDDEASKRAKDEAALLRLVEEDKIPREKAFVDLNPDVFSGQTPQTDEEKAALAKDEEEVRHACTFLMEKIIPRLASDLREGDASFPIDGQALTSLMHKRGVNVRYLGRLAQLAAEAGDDARTQAVKRLAVREMVARAFKHVANAHLRNVPQPLAPAAAAHLLNCFLGERLNGAPAPEADGALKELYGKGDAGYDFEKETPKSLREEVVRQVHMRFRFEIPDGESLVQSGLEMQMLREACLKVGLQIVGREYTFEKAGTSAAEGSDSELKVPESNGTGAGQTGSKGKKKKGGERSPIRNAGVQQTVTFHPEDVVTFVPVIKDSAPKSSLAEEALDGGRMAIAGDAHDLGHELLLESLSLHEQIYGLLHPEVARVYLTLSTLYFSLQEKPLAVELARKSAIVHERTLGLDHAETAFAYLNLAICEHWAAAGNADSNRGGIEESKDALLPAAFSHLRHALELTKLAYGPDHPDQATTLNNGALMLQSMRAYGPSRIWFEAALGQCERLAPPRPADSLPADFKVPDGAPPGRYTFHAAALLFQLSQALALERDHRGAVRAMRESYNTFKALLGPEDRNTRDAEEWLEKLTQSAVSVARQAKAEVAMLAQAGREGRIRRVQFATPGGAGGVAAAVGKEESGAKKGAGGGKLGMGAADTRKIEELVKYIEGADAGKTGKKAGTAATANPKRRGVR